MEVTDYCIAMLDNIPSCIIKVRITVVVYAGANRADKRNGYSGLIKFSGWRTFVNRKEQS